MNNNIEKKGCLNQLARQQAPVGESIALDNRFMCLLHHYAVARSKVGEDAASEDRATEALRVLLAHITAWKDAQLAEARNEGRRDQHETHVALLAENCKLSERLAAQAQGEPVAWACPQDERHAQLEKPDVVWGSDNPWDSGYGAFPLYLGPAPQADEVRAAALEEAAKSVEAMCVEPQLGYKNSVLGKVAKAIRALKRHTAADNQKGGK